MPPDREFRRERKVLGGIMSLRQRGRLLYGFSPTDHPPTTWHRIDLALPDASEWMTREEWAAAHGRGWWATQVGHFGIPLDESEGETEFDRKRYHQFFFELDADAVYFKLRWF